MPAHKITTPFVTPERIAEVLGVSKTRTAKLMRWARESLANGPATETGPIPTQTHDKATASEKADR